MRYIKQIKNFFGILFPRNSKIDPVLQRKYNKTGKTARTCKFCGKHKNVKFFYATTGNVCKPCHNKRTAKYVAERKKLYA